MTPHHTNPFIPATANAEVARKRSRAIFWAMAALITAATVLVTPLGDLTPDVIANAMLP
jgi:hypothetical protein